MSDLVVFESPYNQQVEIVTLKVQFTWPILGVYFRKEGTVS